MTKPSLLKKLAIAGPMILGVVGISTIPQEVKAAALGINSPYGSCGTAVAFAFTLGFQSDTDSDLQCRLAGFSNNVSATAGSGGSQGVQVSARIEASAGFMGQAADIDVGVSLIPPGFGFAGPEDPLLMPINPVPGLPATAEIELANEIIGSNLKIAGSANSNVNAAIELAVVDTGANNYDEFVAFSEELIAIGSIEKALDLGFITPSRVLLRERENSLGGDFDFSVDFGTLNSDQLAITTLTHGVTKPIPEPLTILGSATALGFGALFKRKNTFKKRS